MKTIEIKLFEYSELSDRAKKTALEEMKDVNVHGFWWEHTLDIALHAFNEQFGTCELTQVSFNINEGTISYFTEVDVALYMKLNKLDNKYRTLYNYAKTNGTFMVVAPDKVEFSDLLLGTPHLKNQCRQFRNEFISHLVEFGNYALWALHDECERLTGVEAIVVTIEERGYHFTNDGKLFTGRWVS